MCGVSFNINRIRRVDEPYYAAWYSGESFIPDKSGILDGDDIIASDGCQTRVRRFLSAEYTTNNEDDGDYVDEIDLEDEALEYDSDASSLGRSTDHKGYERQSEENQWLSWDNSRLILSNDVQEVDAKSVNEHKREDPHRRHCRLKRQDHIDGDDHGPGCTANRPEVSIL